MSRAQIFEIRKKSVFFFLQKTYTQMFIVATSHAIQKQATQILSSWLG